MIGQTSEAALDIQDVPRLFSKYRVLLIMGTLLGIALFTAASFVIPKKYKAHFVLTIYSKYFQSPLIGDFVPELSESTNQRDSLIRQVLSPDYLDYLGGKYGLYSGQQGSPSAFHALKDKLKSLAIVGGIYTPPAGNSQLSAERENLLKRITIFAENPTTFDVSFVASDPNTSYQVVQDIYAQLIKSLLELRMHTLANIRDAISKRVGSMTYEMASASGPISKDSRVRSQLENVRSQLHDARQRYTDAHPLVQQLRQRERMLENRLEDYTPESSTDAQKSPEATPAQSGHDTFEDLTKKLNYLNIAIDSDKDHQSDYFATLETPMYPGAPIWPKPALFVLYGLAAGLFGSLFIAALREYFARTALRADSVAQHLGLPILGKLPPAGWKRAPKYLLSSPSTKILGRK